MRYMKHWQDPVNAVLGGLLFLSPWFLGFLSHSLAAGNAMVVGAALVAAGLGASLVPRAWEEWTEGALGLWAAVSPWVLSFTADRTAYIVTFSVGVTVVALSLLVLATDESYAPWLKDRTLN